MTNESKRRPGRIAFVIAWCAFSHFTSPCGAAQLHEHLSADAVSNPWKEWSEAENTESQGHEQRFGLAATAVNGIVYALGGTDGFRSLSLVRYFDPRLGYWQEGPPMPTPRAHLAVVANDGVIYAVGGKGDTRAGALATVEALDSKTGTWSTLPPMPTGRYDFSAVVVNGLLYVIGGRDAKGAIASMEAYNPKTKRWAEKMALPTAVETRGSAAVVDGIIYLMGGNIGGRCLAQIQAYNPNTDTWASESNIPTTDCYFTATVVDDSIFSFGAIRRDGPLTAGAVLIYSPKLRRWQPNTYSLPFIDDFGLARLEGKIYIIGGKEDGRTKTGLRTFDTGARSSMHAPPPPAEAERSAPSEEMRSDVDGVSRRTRTRPDDFALVIGIEKYQAASAADYAERDAAVFQKYATSVLGIPKDNVIVLLNEHASLADFTKYLEEWLPRNVNERSRVYFYFSGHGSPDPTGERSYLMPWDADPAFLGTRAYSLARLYARLEALRAHKVIVLLDACFSGTGPRSLAAKGLRPLVSVSETPVPRNSKLTVMTASAQNEVAGTLEEQRHGLFTYFLLKGLKGDAAKNQGHVELTDLYRYSRDGVSTAAHRQNREQNVQLYGSMPGFELY